MTPLWWMARTQQPIVVGPWISEMGFETLYWLPFLEHLKHTYKLDPQRLYVVSRGGAGVWYGAGHHVELYDYVPPKDLRLEAMRRANERNSVKQLGMTSWERTLLALLAERLGLRRYHVLHPSLLYTALDGFWTTQTMGLAHAMSHLRIVPIPTPPVPVGLSLPEQFVAVRFYQRPTWPLREELVDWVQAMVREIAKTMPVVVLKTSSYLDDHVDFPTPDGQNITAITVEPWRDNLAVQSAILKRAAAFVGTWGGTAQLAVRLGIAAAGFFDRWHSVSYAHRVVTEWIAMQQGTPLFVGRPHDAEFVRTVLPASIAVPESARGSSS